MKYLTNVTQDELKLKYEYSKETGLFTRLISNNQHKSGEIAGALHHSGYIHIRIGKHKYMAHRLAWLYVYGEFPKDMIYHINGNTSDNRISNLREATRSQNLMNRTRDVVISSSGFRGVNYQEVDSSGYIINKPYKAGIGIDGKYVYIGSYYTAEEASTAY